MGEWTRNKRRGYPICMTFGLNMVILCFSSWRSEFRPVCNVRNQQHSSRNHLSYKLEVPKIFTGPLFFYDWGLALYHRIWLEHLKKQLLPSLINPGRPFRAHHIYWPTDWSSWHIVTLSSSRRACTPPPLPPPAPAIIIESKWRLSFWTRANGECIYICPVFMWV